MEHLHRQIISEHFTLIKKFQKTFEKTFPNRTSNVRFVLYDLIMPIAKAVKS